MNPQDLLKILQDRRTENLSELNKLQTAVVQHKEAALRLDGAIEAVTMLIPTEEQQGS